MDYAGPILFNDAQLKQGPQKALFICMVAGAVHLELTTSDACMSPTLLDRVTKIYIQKRETGANFQGIASEISRAYNKEEFDKEFKIHSRTLF